MPRDEGACATYYVVRTRVASKRRRSRDARLERGEGGDGSFGKYQLFWYGTVVPIDDRDSALSPQVEGRAAERVKSASIGYIHTFPIPYLQELL